MKTAITGATGQLGRWAVEKLKQRLGGEQLIALVRTPEKAANLGIEVRPFDYTKAEQLAEGLKGVDHLLLISGNEIGQRAPQHRNIIEAAKKAEVKWIVYTSLLRADTTSLSLADEHVETENMLKDSGIPHTILRNGWYTENYTVSIPAALENGALVGSAGQGKISSATREDYAEAAAVVLSTQGHVGKVYELAGDESYTLDELAAELSRQVQREIPYKDLPEEQYAGILASAGIPEFYAKALASFDIDASNGALFDQGKELSKLISRETTSFSQAIKQALDQKKDQ